MSFTQVHTHGILFSLSRSLTHTPSYLTHMHSHTHMHEISLTHTHARTQAHAHLRTGAKEEQLFFNFPLFPTPPAPVFDSSWASIDTYSKFCSLKKHLRLHFRSNRTDLKLFFAELSSQWSSHLSNLASMQYQLLFNDVNRGTPTVDYKSSRRYNSAVIG